MVLQFVLYKLDCSGNSKNLHLICEALFLPAHKPFSPPFIVVARCVMVSGRTGQEEEVRFSKTIQYVFSFLSEHVR